MGNERLFQIRWVRVFFAFLIVAIMGCSSSDTTGGGGSTTVVHLIQMHPDAVAKVYWTATFGAKKAAVLWSYYVLGGCYMYLHYTTDGGKTWTDERLDDLSQFFEQNCLPVSITRVGHDNGVIFFGEKEKHKVAMYYSRFVKDGYRPEDGANVSFLTSPLHQFAYIPYVLDSKGNTYSISGGFNSVAFRQKDDVWSEYYAALDYLYPALFQYKTYIPRVWNIWLDEDEHLHLLRLDKVGEKEVLSHYLIPTQKETITQEQLTATKGYLPGVVRLETDIDPTDITDTQVWTRYGKNLLVITRESAAEKSKEFYAVEGEKLTLMGRIVFGGPNFENPILGEADIKQYDEFNVVVLPEGEWDVVLLSYNGGNNTHELWDGVCEETMFWTKIDWAAHKLEKIVKSDGLTVQRCIGRMNYFHELHVSPTNLLLWKDGRIGYFYTGFVKDEYGQENLFFSYIGPSDTGEIEEKPLCESGKSESCYSFPPGTEGVGTCHPGSHTCKEGK